MHGKSMEKRVIIGEKWKRHRKCGKIMEKHGKDMKKLGVARKKHGKL